MQNSDDITDLPQAKRGKPILIDEKLDNEVLAHVKNVHESGSVINTPLDRLIGAAL